MTSSETAATAAVTSSEFSSRAESFPIAEPSRVEATSADIDSAKASSPREVVPNLLQQSEVDDIKSVVGDQVNLQWQPDWVSQDENFRPVIFNPLRESLQIVYLDRGDPRTLTIQPLTSAVVELARGAYGITVMVLDTVGRVRDVAVGNVFSGQPPESRTKVSVLVDYSTETYKPITVEKVTDLGEDPEVGERKILLDDSTPVWGTWTETSTGEMQFKVHKTQQLPGIDAPAEGPLPGNYELVAASEPLSSTDVLLILVALLIAALALGAVIARIVRSSQRNRHGLQGPRVQAVCSPGAPVAVTVREIPDGAEVTHAIRLVTLSGPTILTIREVNDDHSRANQP
ncbi:hypothetical protein [Mycobacterium sp. 3519A]|uniref:hypothetical protein n=1 Tax=Mycobacterium sp. 3519A TaxID=2057184 RepID=UPI00115C0596|nr:hypothetical protein [Mycobacterium sp. 3519A]